MKAKYELLRESDMDVEDLEAERDLQLAAVDAIRRARRFGTNYVIWENDRVIEVPPNKTAPYEVRLLTRAEELDKRIQVLRPVPVNVTLNEKPVR